MRLENKVAIITGAGGGQGRAAALLFAGEGAKIVASDWNAESGEETAALVNAAGGAAVHIGADVSAAAQVRRLIDGALESFGRIDVLYNNAGVGYSSSLSMHDILKTPEEDWDRVLAINLKSVFLTCKCAIPEMLKTGGGSIINTSSVAALVGGENAHAYTAAKGGMISLSRALAVEFGPHNIRVNCICPGVIDTPMVESVVRPFKDPARPFRISPIRRLGTPEDIAYCALYLASEESSFVTGATFVIDGGITAR
ncbi:MAG TPA: SDR family NAD(P)-dependent oxidoreductase [Candidatus Binataceae bacterium]|jgi:NAD(P)-dependent dehydrogenase (short-subunit alcohol dehydrogenase family)|nr:SDR family NAD(P)-dependent oxidoreductase [Candidatus Binataceae bacterium]